MLKKLVIVVGIVVVGLAIYEVVSLLRLKKSVESYAEYWKDYPKEGELTMVVLGDSAAQSVGASRPERGYVGLLGEKIERKTGKKLGIVNLSVSGATVDDVVNNQVPMLKDYQPDILIVEIGGNDVVHYKDAAFAKSYQKLAGSLPDDTIIANVGYFGGRIRKNDEAIQANKHIAAASKKYDLPLVDLQTITKERQSIRNYSADLFHPGDTGYQNWADAFWLVIEPRL